MDHWPTEKLPLAPVSAKTHGDPITWTMFEWIPFNEWAKSLESYGPTKKRIHNRTNSAKRVQPSPKGQHRQASFND